MAGIGIAHEGRQRPAHHGVRQMNEPRERQGLRAPRHRGVLQMDGQDHDGTAHRRDADDQPAVHGGGRRIGGLA
eukprot:3358172-Prymnesium_polylepis.1